MLLSKYRLRHIQYTRTSMEIFQLMNDEGITIVMVTHEVDIAETSKRKEDTTNRIIASEKLIILPKPEEVII